MVDATKTHYKWYNVYMTLEKEVFLFFVFFSFFQSSSFAIQTLSLILFAVVEQRYMYFFTTSPTEK